MYYVESSAHVEWYKIIDIVVHEERHTVLTHGFIRLLASSDQLCFIWLLYIKLSGIQKLKMVQI